MEETLSTSSDALEARDTEPLLPVLVEVVEDGKLNSDGPLTAGEPARLSPPSTPQGAAAAIRRAKEEENSRIDFIQRLVPGYIPVVKTSALPPSSTSIIPEEYGAVRFVSPTEHDQATQDEEKQKTEFVQRLIPSYIPISSTDEATMGHLTTPPHNNGSAVMMTVLAGVALLWFMLTATGGLEFGANCSGDMRQEVATGAGKEAVVAKRLVPLEAHVMSKCPDTKACLKELVLPAMERISPKVDFRLSFLGRPTANDGVECMHGTPECLGNILLLCAAHYYPTPLSLPFAMCLENDYTNIPSEELIRQCALEHAIDFDKLNECASDQDTGLGLKLLRDSVERSIEKQVRKSCTVRLADQVYCIHDGDWKECPKGPGVNDLVVEIEKLYNSQEF